MLHKLIIALGLTALLAAPAFAQSYTPSYGGGNVINQPLAEQTNGAEGIGANAFAAAPNGSSAFAYAPKDTKGTHTSRKARSRMH